MAANIEKPKLIFVLGPTGSGKTKLAVEIALALGENGGCGAEIVNCDSIQMYKGLDVASAKATMMERRGIPHHLLSFLQPRDNFTVRDYRMMAGKAIDDIISRGKMAVVTGGTLYYAQALMREGGVLNELDELKFASTEIGTKTSSISSSSSSSLETVSLDALESDQVATVELSQKREMSSETHDGEVDDNCDSNYLRLQKVDPIMARRLHPHDKRKIARALQAFDTTGGVPYSTVLSLQAKRIDGSTGPYNCKIICLVVSDRTVHNERLDKRAQDMLAKGLVSEQRVLRDYLAGRLTDVASELTQDIPSELTTKIVKEMISTSSTGLISNSSIDERSEHAGLLQAIGYKEFADYLDLVDKSQERNLDENAVSTETSIEEEKKEVERVKKRQRLVPPDKDAEIAASLQVAERRLCDVTHQYARKQERWLRNRFANRGVTMTTIDTSCVTQKISDDASHEDSPTLRWEKHVLAPAMNDIRSWIAINEVPAAPESSRIEAWNQYICEVCNGKLLNGELAWKEHVSSKPHKHLQAQQTKKLRGEDKSQYKKIEVGNNL
jgi:tRNA A37 N6-isopentenylltransferase MiaA